MGIINKEINCGGIKMGYRCDYRLEWGLEPSFKRKIREDSAIARSYANMFADRMQEDNLDEIDKNHVAGMIYAVLMQDDKLPTQKAVMEYVDARPDKEQLFKDEEFEI
jgi:hypothetical protein